MKRLRRRLKWKSKPLFLKTSFWLNRMVERISGRAVMQGPFAGLKYIPGIPGDSYTPQLLGTYELELHEGVAELSHYKPDVAVNVGAGEGFYAIGFARLSPDAGVVAFEANEQMRGRLSAMAAANSVASAIAIHGTCDPASLESSLAGARPLVIMDVDGGEDQLLDPVAVPSLLRSAILVETHDIFVPGITRSLIERFKDSHDINEIRTRSRRMSDLPNQIPAWMRLPLMRAMREHRGGEQAWLVMLPRAAP